MVSGTVVEEEYKVLAIGVTTNNWQYIIKLS
jgi:hypothetical protein